MWYYKIYIFGGDWYLHDLRIMSKLKEKKGYWIKTKINNPPKIRKNVTDCTWSLDQYDVKNEISRW